MALDLIKSQRSLREIPAAGQAIQGFFHAVARVAERVRLGGHDVPEAVIRRRYLAGLRNFFQLYQPMADMGRFYDNSRPSTPRLVAAGHDRIMDAIVDADTWLAIRNSRIK